MAFIGWTARGIPKVSPVRIEKSPNHIRAPEAEAEPAETIPTIRGKKVPRSPREPETSFKASPKLPAFCSLFLS